jgi:hypothetical protein
MSRFLLACIPLVLVAGALVGGCASPAARNGCLLQHEVYLGLTNRSMVDTLAYVTVAVDDSVVFAQPLRVNQSSGTTFQRVLRVCDGPHRVYVHMGRYAKDTVLVVQHPTSLLVLMDYETAYVHHNSIRIATLNRDDPSIHAID